MANDKPRILDVGHYIFLTLFAILLFLILFIFLQSAHELFLRRAKSDTELKKNVE